MRYIKICFLALAASAVLSACSPAQDNDTGSEYMPDMGHSVAYESNVYGYYHYNTWDSASVFKRRDLSNPRLPVKGTIARGYAGISYLQDPAAQADLMMHLRGGTGINEIAVPINGNVPYYYKDTEEERIRASAQIIGNPFPITAKGLAQGKELYDIFCGICHGAAGNGLGYLVSEENVKAVYPAAPANFLQDTFLNSSNGRFYHGIIYGKNVMGGYADKLSYEERWQVIHYIRSLQAKEKKLVYDENANTLNPAYGIPASKVRPVAQTTTDNQPAPDAAQQQGQQQTTGDGSHQ